MHPRLAPRAVQQPTVSSLLYGVSMLRRRKLRVGETREEIDKDNGPPGSFVLSSMFLLEQ